MLPTYQTQFNKITEAYIRGEIEPFNQNFCFCGTLCDGQPQWIRETIDGLDYSNDDFYHMEKALYKGLEPIGLLILGRYRNTSGTAKRDKLEENPDYEDALFNGMVNALEVLKQIHIDKGEKIDETPVFNKRQKNGLHNECLLS